LESLSGSILGISLHRDELLEDWRLASEMKEIKKIEPLK
jgi:hypothetical protein